MWNRSNLLYEATLFDFFFHFIVEISGFMVKRLMVAFNSLDLINAKVVDVSDGAHDEDCDTWILSEIL